MAYNRRNAKKDDSKFIANPAMLPQVFSKRTRKCPLESVSVDEINFKNIALLKGFISERGKILPRRITNVSSKKQRELAKAIKNARNLALLPFVDS